MLGAGDFFLIFLFLLPSDELQRCFGHIPRDNAQIFTEKSITVNNLSRALEEVGRTVQLTSTRGGNSLTVPPACLTVPPGCTCPGPRHLYWSLLGNSGVISVLITC